MTPLPAELLSAVLADPDADGPRLACADWLEEHGEHDAAALIRLELAAPVRGAAKARRAEAARLRRALVARVPGLAPRESARGATLETRRGFGVYLSVHRRPALADRALLAAIADAFPLLELLTIAPSSALTGADLPFLVERLPLLARLNVTLADGEIADEQLAPLAGRAESFALWLRDPRGREIPVGERLARLDAEAAARAATLDAAGAEAAVRRRFGGRTSVYLWREPTGWLPAVARCPSVRALTVSGEGAAVEALPPNLRSLTLIETGRLAPALLSGLSGLRSLHLDSTALADEVAALCAALPGLPRLESLELWLDALPPAAVESLNRCAGLRRLEIHLAARAWVAGPFRLPELLEYEGPTPPDPDGCPRLRVARFAGRGAKRAAARLAERAVVQLQSSAEVEAEFLRRFAQDSVPFAAGGATLRLPAGLSPLPTPAPRDGVTPLGAWAEWGDGGPLDRTSAGGPTWVLLERLDFAVLPERAWEFLAGPPAANGSRLDWPAGRPLAARAGRPSVLIRETEADGGSHLRAVWPGGERGYRLIAEHAEGRAVPWAALLRRAAETLRV